MIIDPANASNNVASRIESDERESFVKAARTAWETITLGQGLEF